MTPGEMTGANVTRFRIARGLSTAALARAVGVRVFTVQQIEAGKTQKSRYIVDIARVLDVEPGDLDERLKRATAPVPPASAVADLLVYGTTEAGDGALVLSQDPIDRIERPRSLTHARDAYAVMVTGESMWPMVRPGDVVVLNPNKYPRREDLCVFRSERHGEFKSTIKEFVGRTADGWRVKRYRPEEKEFTLKGQDWSECHVVVTIHRP
jgi:phage repressor protein C with HTH and peptisase S24 domain